MEGFLLNPELNRLLSMCCGCTKVPPNLTLRWKFLFLFHHMNKTAQ